MSLYNITNVTASINPIIWIRTINIWSNGAFAICLPLTIWFIILISGSKGQNGDTTNAFHAANFATASIEMILWIAKLQSNVLIFVLFVLVAISCAMLVKRN